MESKPNYYSNPAFCQQSEFHPQKVVLSPQRSVRQSPVGAQTSHVVFDNSLSDLHDRPDECVDNIEEQEFYEEVIVDGNGFIKGKKFVVVAQNNEGQKYIQLPQEERKGSRHGSSQQIHYNPPKNPPFQAQKSRYEYIPMQEQDPRYMPALARSTPKKSCLQEEHIEIIPGVVHRYAVIEAEEETELTNRNERYALVPVNELNNVVSPQNKNRYEYIKDSSTTTNIQQVPSQQPNRYEYIQSTPPKSETRYEYIQQSTPQHPNTSRYDYPSSHNMPRPGTNPIATKKLHELLSTPKKTKSGYQGQTPQKIISPQPPRRLTSPPLSPITKDPFQTPKSSPQRATRPSPNSKFQQKLNYAIGSKQLVNQDKRHTAIVPPMCSSPVQSIYGETTYSQKSESWMNLSVKASAGQVLAITAFIMCLCGVATTGLSLYMLSFMGRPYYLDFSTVAGFTCAIMGLLGCRSRNVYWLPNRNYLSGYFVLSVFSLLTCAGLLLLLVNDDPRPGTPLVDMTSAIICGFSVLTLLLTLTGVVSSYCCKYPPPDNRVQHCSPGLTV